MLHFSDDSLKKGKEKKKKGVAENRKASRVITVQYAAIDDLHMAGVVQSSFLEARALLGTQPAAGVDLQRSPLRGGDEQAQSPHVDRSVKTSRPD